MEDQEYLDQKLEFIMESEHKKTVNSADKNNPKHVINLMIEVKHEKALLIKENKKLMNRLRSAQDEARDLSDKPGDRREERT